jgi:hypothetical protein
VVARVRTTISAGLAAVSLISSLIRVASARASARDVVRERLIDRLEDLGAGAEVGLQRRAAVELLQQPAALLEQLHVGVPEAVDRLLGVADREQVAVRDQLDQLQLDPVRVLELVDHDLRKAGLVALAQRRVGGEQVARQQLEVLEVDPGGGALVIGVVGGEAL